MSLSSESGSGAASPPTDDDTPTASMPIVTTSVTSTANTPDVQVGRHAAADDSGDDRGRLAIADVVVEKVATAAAGEIAHVGGSARRVLGVPTGRDTAQQRPQVSATVSGQIAALDVRLSVTYPASVRATTEAVRSHLRERVQALTELTVSRVDITISALTAASTAPAGRVIK